MTKQGSAADCMGLNGSKWVTIGLLLELGMGYNCMGEKQLQFDLSCTKLQEQLA